MQKSYGIIFGKIILMFTAGEHICVSSSQVGFTGSPFPVLGSGGLLIGIRNKTEGSIFFFLGRGQPTRGGPPAWGLGVGLTTPHHKIFFIVTKCFKVPWTWTDSLAQPKRWKKDMRFRTWNIGVSIG
jgi:hypothetical protein